ncbi:MAG: ABC transporter ATP-binding protein, partial [Myxococcales bacterium]|nr:ABC transporter ATP-binding protein [Myxococcales bacterium]
MSDNKTSSNSEAEAKNRAKGFHEEKQIEAGSDVGLMYRLWHYVRPYKKQFWAAIVLMPLASLVALIEPHLIQVAIDEHITVRELDGLGLIAALFATSIVVQFVLQAAQMYLTQWVGLKALADLRLALFKRVNRLRLSFFHANPVGRLMTRLTTDVDSLQEAVSGGMVSIVSDLVTVAGIVIVLLVKDVKLALVTFTCLPLLFGLSVLFRYLLRKAFQIIRVKIARLGSFLQEAVTGMVIIQLFNRERKSSEEFEEINRDYRDAQILQVRWDAMLYAVVEGISSVAIALIIWYGSGRALQDLVSLGVLVAFVEYAQRFFAPIRDLSQKYSMYQSALASA